MWNSWQEKFDDICTNRKNLNSNKIERETIHKFGCNGQYGVDSSFAYRVPHWAELHENERKLSEEKISYYTLGGFSERGFKGGFF